MGAYDDGRGVEEYLNEETLVWGVDQRKTHVCAGAYMGKVHPYAP